jgi:hypothetical protein
MNLKNYQPLLNLLLISVVVFGLHEAFFFIFGVRDIEGFQLLLVRVYAFFILCSAVIIFILIKVKEKSIDNVGSTFLLLTCLKMAAAYVFLKQLVNAEGSNPGFERANFFIVFAIFLAIETILTIRILNKR